MPSSRVPRAIPGGGSEWTKYRIVAPPGSALETVYHVVHIPTARRILEDGRLKAGLVYDKSRLRESRIAVTWLSANTWAYGSIYGNVQFSFQWTDLIHSRQFYWVEAMTGYSPHAYRLLVTDRDFSGSPHVQEYDPSSDDGPLRRIDGAWYWNGDCTSEFMLDGDLDLANCTGLEFIMHRKDICRSAGSACPYRETPMSETAGRMIAFILGHGLHSIDHVLKQPSVWDETRPLSDAVDRGIGGIIHALGAKEVSFDGPIDSTPSRNAVTQGALALYATEQDDAARELLTLLEDEPVLRAALTDMINEHFNITGWTIAY